MPNPWFRLYDEVVDDPKVQLLPDRLFKAWINFMCIANKGTPRGKLPEIKQIAYRLHVTPIRAEALAGELVAAGLFEWKDGFLYSHNWNSRQFNSDGSTERMRRWRERHGDGDSDVTDTVTKLRYTDPDTEADTDTESETPKVPAPPALDTGFEDFWQIYPRKIGKTAALKAWKRIAPKNGMREIISTAVGAQKLSEQWLKDNGQFIPHPATWLNQGRWDDEIDTRVTDTAKTAKELFRNASHGQ